MMMMVIVMVMMMMIIVFNIIIITIIICSHLEGEGGYASIRWLKRFQIKSEE